MTTQLTKRKATGNERSTDSLDQPTRAGIDWINLMMISEHTQPDSRKGKTESATTWTFRIELDTTFKDPADAVAILKLLRAKQFDAAKTELKKRRPDSEDASIGEFIDAAFRNRGASSIASSSFTSQEEVVVQVIEDFGRGVADTNRETARTQLGVSLNAGTADQLRKDVQSDEKSEREKAKNTLKRQVSTKKKRARRLLDATLD